MSEWACDALCVASFNPQPQAMMHWFTDHERLILWMFGLSVLMFVGTLIVLPILIVRMPADYFLHRTPPPDSWRGRHPAVRLAVLVVKNFVGIVLLGAGFIMLFTPGQGVLAILVGLSMMNVPGKRRLELRIVRSKPVSKAINWIRAKSHRAPLELPARGERTGREKTEDERRETKKL